MRIVHRLLFTFLACTTLAPGLRAIDFTPRYTETVEEGFPFRRMYFTEGNTRIFFRPPANWKIAGQASAISFHPEGLTSASVRLEAAPPEHAAIPLNEKGLETLRTIARSLVPAQFTDAVEQGETVNPVIIHDWTSFEASFTYASQGVPFHRSVLFINLGPNRQIRVVVESSAADFEKLHEAALRCLSTWWEVSK